MTTNTDRVGRLIQKAARSVLLTRGLDLDHLDDLVQDMWTEYMQWSSTQRAVAAGSDDEAVSYLRKNAGQLLSGQARAESVAAGEWLYSSEAIKDALKGRGLNPSLESLLPAAIEQLEDRHPPYASALKSRYIDGVVPQEKPDQNALVRAHQALAEELHAVVVEYNAEIDGPGSRGVVFPDSIKAHDGHADPTGDAAALLADRGDDLGVDGYTYRQVFDLLNEDEVPVGHGAGHKGILPNLFDPEFGDLVHAEMYRSWVSPELYPNEKQPLLSNWDPQDLEMFIGGTYTAGYNRKAA